MDVMAEAKYNTHHDARGRFGSGGGGGASGGVAFTPTKHGRRLTDDELYDLQDDRAKIEKKYAHLDGDSMLMAIADKQGFDAKPKLVSKAEMDRLVADGHTELLRGETDEKYAETFKAGEYRAGNGLYGSGIYTALADRDMALETVSGFAGEHGRVTRMVLKKDARIVDFEDNVDRAASATKFRDIVGDYGRYAAARGYDAVNIGPYLIVLNRGAVIVQRDSIDVLVDKNVLEETDKFTLFIDKSKPATGQGIMAALYPSRADADDLAIHPDSTLDDPEPPDDLHVTLLYFGTLDDVSYTTVEAARMVCADVAASFAAPMATVSGVARFSTDDKDPIVLLINSQEILAIRERMADELAGLFSDKYVYTPHMTLAYVPRGEEVHVELPTTWTTEKYNRNHDAKGRFAPGGGGGGGGSGDLNELASVSELDSEWENVEANLTENEDYAIDQYSSDGYEGLQSSLRHGESLTSEEKKIADGMDSVIGKTITTQPIALFRKADDLGINVGDTFVDHGFVSTTTRYGIARDFEGVATTNAIVYSIRVPAGTKILPLNGGSNWPEEREIVLPRNTKFRVVERDGPNVLLDVVS